MHACFSSWIKERVVFMSSDFFGSWIKEPGIFMCSTLVSAHGLKNEVYSCVPCLFRLID